MFMEPHSDVKTSPRTDGLLLAVALLLLVGGMGAFYALADQFNALVRVLILLAALAAAIATAYRTELGRTLWGYVVGSRAELRKVVWPTRQESIQVTLMIAVVVVIMSLILWGLDAVLLRIVKLLTGRG
jgi:preprotein translocase subunit SecE